jgi:cytochrome P450 PksS
MTKAANRNLASRQHNADPYPYYARLRRDSPVHKVILPDKQVAWLVTRYDDVLGVLKDDRFVKDRLNALTPKEAGRQPWVPAFAEPLTRNMLDVDDPDHTRLRGLVNRAFTPRRVEQIRDRIESLTEELLAAVRGRKRFDLIGAIAQPIPTTIIAEMLGVPVEDRGKFGRWSRRIVSADSSAAAMMLAIPNFWFFLRYIRRLVRVQQGETRDDMLGALVRAEADGERLNEDELLAMVFLLLVAGHETTVNLIGNGVLALMEHPEQMRMLRRDPSLIKPAIEELLRYGSPLKTATERYAREDVTVAGVKIPRGSLVLAVIASANRDERQFTNPDTLDITREPNRHLSFGMGAHFCLGASLARMEGQIAIATLLSNITKWRLAVAPRSLRWRRGLVLRGLEAMPVVVDQWT